MCEITRSSSPFAIELWMFNLLQIKIPLAESALFCFINDPKSFYFYVEWKAFSYEIISINFELLSAQLTLNVWHVI